MNLRIWSISVQNAPGWMLRCPGATAQGCLGRAAPACPASPRPGTQGARWLRAVPPPRTCDSCRRGTLELLTCVVRAAAAWALPSDPGPFRVLGVPLRLAPAAQGPTLATSAGIWPTWSGLGAESSRGCRSGHPRRRGQRGRGGPPRGSPNLSLSEQRWAGGGGSGMASVGRGIMRHRGRGPHSHAGGSPAVALRSGCVGFLGPGRRLRQVSLLLARRPAESQLPPRAGVSHRGRPLL